MTRVDAPTEWFGGSGSGVEELTDARFRMVVPAQRFVEAEASMPPS
jgi:hypothetical protein